MIVAADKKAVRLTRRLLPNNVFPPVMNRLLLFLPLLVTFGFQPGPTELDRLPAPTRQGLATAGWLLNGHAHVPQRSARSAGNPVVGYWEKTAVGRSLSLSFRELSRDGNQGVGLFLPDIRRAGTYALDRTGASINDVSNAAYGEYYRVRPLPDLNGFTGPDAPGQLVITRFDTVQHVVAGTFAMSLRPAGNGTPLVITHGRFDVHFTRR